MALLPVAQIAQGAPLNLSRLEMGSHTGTHIDAPSHFIPGGATAEQLSLEVFIGPAQVVEMACQGGISVADLQEAAIPADTRRLLLKTSNSRLWAQREFSPDYTYLLPEAAAWIVERGIRLVGIDYLSVERFGSADFATHITLLSNGVLILEGLDLGAVSPGRYTLVCLPMKLVGGDGAPARTVLLEDGWLPAHPELVEGVSGYLEEAHDGAT